MNVSFGVLSSPSTPAGNVTNQINQMSQLIGKPCIDLHQRRVPHRVHFYPGPDECTICACVHGKARYCKAVLCAPPENCKSYKIGDSSCCDFTCLDDSRKGNGNNPFENDPSLNRPTLATRILRNALILAVILLLLFIMGIFAIRHTLYQIDIQDRPNPAGLGYYY